MWRNRKDNSSSLSIPETGNAADSISGRAQAIASSAFVGSATSVRGQVGCRESLYVDAAIEGTLQVPDNCRITVGPQAKINANAKAQEIDVIGSIVGDLEATTKITVRRGGRVTGDLRTPIIVVEEGAEITGRIEVLEPEPESKPMGTQPSIAKAAAAGA